MVQMVLANPSNCVGYFNNVKLSASGFNWTWNFEGEPAVA